jgi:SAM-dependent methyltransferase
MQHRVAFSSVASRFAAAVVVAGSLGGLGAGAVLAQEPALDVVYVPTPQPVVDKMLELAKVTKDDYVIDLGSGDGRIPITAAKEYGAKAFGIDLNPQRIQEASENLKKEKLEDKVTFKEGNLFEQDLGEADVITMYLLTSINLKLRPELLKLDPGTRVVSHAFDMGDWEPDQKETVDGKSVYFWVVPARVDGGWKMTSKDGAEIALQIEQKYQGFTGTARMADKSMDVTDGKLMGEEISFKIDGQSYVGKVEGDAIKGDGWQAAKS